MLAFDFLSFFLVFALLGGLKDSMQLYSVINQTPPISLDQAWKAFADTAGR